MVAQRNRSRWCKPPSATSSSSPVGKAHVESAASVQARDLSTPAIRAFTPLYPGKHPINSRVMKVEPTTNIVLNQHQKRIITTRPQSITCARGGFAFNRRARSSTSARRCRIISRVGRCRISTTSSSRLWHHLRTGGDTVLTSSAQSRGGRQHIREPIGAMRRPSTRPRRYQPPAQLMQTQITRKIVEEQRKTYEVQEATQRGAEPAVTSSTRSSAPSA